MHKYYKIKLTDIATFSQGKQISVDNQLTKKTSGTYRFLRIVDYTDRNVDLRYTKENDAKYKVASDDLVMIRYGSQTAGRVVRGFEGIIANNMFKLSFNKEYELDKGYLYYYLSSKSIYNYLMNAQVSSTMPAITFDMLEDIYITVPDITEQQKIADILSALDDKIELNNKINAELEATAKDLYNYWFVQFDFPDGNGRPYKSSGGKMVYNPILKREIPDGWTVECLAKNCLANILKPGIQVFEGEKIYLPTAAIEGDKIVDKTNVITYKNREGRANMQPVSNSIWFAKMKNTQKTLYFGEYSKENLDVLILSTGMCGVKCSKNALEYIWNFVNDCGFERIKNKLSHGATQEGINNDDLFYFPILVPTNDVLTAFSSLTNKLYMEKYSKEKENDSLVNLRDFLLPMLMNGQVSVE